MFDRITLWYNYSMSKIHFETKLFKINSKTILLLPKNISFKLPSRGMTYVKGTINNFPFQAALEPDGRGSHWLKIDQAMSKVINASVGDVVTLEIESSKEWSEPKVPEDLKIALKSALQADQLWQNITPMARWDWIRFINSTKVAETRKRRIEVTLSKLNKGEKRPCCFNRSLCCDPSVSKNGVLLESN